MAHIDLDTVVARGTEQVETRMGDQTVMMSIEQGQYFALGASGQRIWELLETPVRVRDLVDQLADEYDVPREQCEADVVGFLRTLDENGLLSAKAA